MKLKYILFTLLFCIGLLASCTDESAIGNGGGNPTLPEGHAMVTFTFNGIGGTPRSYADIAPDSDSLECRIDSVMIYVFNNDMDNDGTADETLAPADNAVLENIAKVKVEPGVSTAKNEFQAQTTFINKGHKWFVVVANFKDTATVYAGMQYSLFKQHCTPDISTLPTVPFIMSGMGAGMLSSNAPLQTNIELVRLVTRIDITIRNTAEVNATSPFKLKEVRFANVNQKGFLLWNSDGVGGFNEPANERYTTEWIDVTGAIENNAVTGTDSVWHYLYTYETLAKTGEQVVLELKGEYNGQLSEYKIALTQDEDDTADPKIPLRNLVRNHRYLVYIDSVTYTDVIGEVIVADWDFTPRDTIPYEPEVSFGSPKATIQNVGNYTILPGTQIGNFSTDTLITPDAGYTNDDVIVIDLESYNVRSAFSSTVSWITAEEVSSYSIISDTVAIQQRFKVTITANDAADSPSRDGYFEFRNPILTNNKVGYAVLQIGTKGIGTTGKVATGTGITVDNIDKTITMSAFNRTGSVAFTFDKNAVIDIPASASARLSLGAVSYATKTQVINIAPNLSYEAVNDTVTFRYPGTDSSEEQYVFIHQAATTTITPTAVTGGVLSLASSAYSIGDVAAAGGTLTIEITDNLESPAYELTADDSWLTYVSQSVTTTADGTDKQVTVYTFSVGDNSAADTSRITTVTFTNSGGGTRSIAIGQKGTPVIPMVFSGTPLAKWAKGNLRAVDSDNWLELTPELAGTRSAEVYGATFQWGRKVAFPATTEAAPATSADKVAFADGATISTWITQNPWHSETGNGADVWTKLRSMTEAIDNDPCPSGWRLPTNAEILEIATASNTDWVPGGSWATGNVKIVGAYAVYYRWVAGASAYMEVKMLPTTVNGITAENIISVDWSDSRVETRYFPAAGRRTNSNGNASNVGVCYYWGSVTTNDTGASSLHFESTSASRRTHYRSYGYSVRCVQN